MIATRLTVNGYHKTGRINKNIYGQFSEHLGRGIYEGIFVGKDSPIPNKNGIRTDVVNALRQVRVPVVRWPGGNFADEYHWMDGIGDPANRPAIINTHWGGTMEDNSFGTHEYFDFCSQVGCAPYVNVNVGSGRIEEMQKWIEYITFGGESPMARLRSQNGHADPWMLKYVGIGNENWLCGGNMTAEYYGDVYRRYQTYIRNYGEEPIFKIACGPLDDDYSWTDTIMRKASGMLDAISLHYYTYPGVNVEGCKGESIYFGEKEWYNTIKKSLHIEELIEIHTGVMRRYDPACRVGFIIDEWGNWYNPEPGTIPGHLYQQNTMRDAVTAAANLNIFNNHCDRIVMTNIAQMVNVLQALLLTRGEQMIKTPTYHVYDMYKYHQDAQALQTFLETEETGTDEDRIPCMNCSASSAEDGTITITIVNFSVEEAYEVDCILLGILPGKIEASCLSGEINAYNDFDTPDRIHISTYDDVRKTGDGIIVSVPAGSVLCVRVHPD